MSVDFKTEAAISFFRTVAQTPAASPLSPFYGVQRPVYQYMVNSDRNLRQRGTDFQRHMNELVWCGLFSSGRGYLLLSCYVVTMKTRHQQLA